MGTTGFIIYSIFGSVFAIVSLVYIFLGIKWRDITFIIFALLVSVLAFANYSDAYEQYQNSKPEEVLEVGR